MADTVKKSRIVSDPECLATYADNLNTEDTSLQDIINQEFNQRLKSCMQNEPYLEPNEEHLALTYEQGEVVLKNGDLKAQITQPTTLELNTETSVLTTKEPEEENGENEVLKTQDKESTPTTDNKGLNGNITAQNIPEEPSINNDKHSTNGLHHSEINPPTLETDQLCEKVQDQTSPDDSFINKEIPSPEDEIESPFDNITVTDVDNENLTAKERFLSTIKDIDDDDINAKLATVKDRMFLSTDSAILFTQTVVQSPMLTPTEESYDFLQALGQNSSDTNVTILEDQNSSVKIEENSLPKEDIVIVADKEDKDEISEISAENEVCNKLDTSISEEDVSECFKNEENLQQLDESEENMKEITSKFIENEISETDGELLLLKSTVASKTIPIVKTPTIVEHLVEDVDPEEEDYIDSFNRSQEIYEAEQHLEEALKENTTEEEIKDLPIDNSQLEDIKSSEEVSENKILEKPTKFDSTVLELSLTKPHSEESEHKAETAINNEEENEEIVKSPTKVSEISKIFTPKDSESPKEETKSPVLDETFEDIKKTKEIFERISFTGSDEPKTNLKSCEMVKRLSDPLSPGSDISDCGDPTNTVCRSDFSTTTTSEASFVETRTEINSNQDKVLKKKKSKKSKKDNEKENISVCDYTNTNDDDTLSHVSVKNLCRSFSDLTSIGSKNVDPKLKARITTGRTKSMSDIRRDDITLENVFSNVSVKTLRECFDNLTNRTTNQCFERSSLNNHIKPIVTTSDRIEKLKSSFSKFDALQKKTVLHVRSSDSGKAQEKFNGTTTQVDTSSCKSCSKQVFQMEQIKAEKAIWHKNCFRCKECNKQLNVDTYQSNEGVLYCKPHFKALFTPKAVEDEPQPIRPRKHELIIRENQPEELPPDVVRASDKPDLGLEELQNLNVKERFQVFEQHDSQENNLERTPSAVNVKRSPSILSKLAKFQSKGMDIGVADDSLNGIPVEESSSEEEEEEEEIEGEDADLVRAKRAQREKPLHFNNMSDIMSKWESGNQMTKEERREERKQEIQSIRSRLFMGKQAKIKEMYQQAVADSSSGAHVRKQVPLDTELCEGARTLRERFERGEQLTSAEQQTLRDLDDAEVFESGISKKSRSIFQELDANASKPPMIQQAQTKASTQEVRRAREAFMARQASDDIVRSSDQVDDVTVKTADISSRFKFFETYKEPEKQRKQFRITPPRDGKDKLPDAPEEENAPPEIIEPDTAEATASHTATRMLNMFRQMEESAGREQMPTGPKPLKRFTPPPEPQRPESESEGEYSEEEDDEEDDAGEQRNVDEDLIEAQKAARAKHLRAKFEKWEANEIKREQNNSSVNIAEEMGDADSQIESAKSLCARFESMRETSTDKERTPRVKVNRFVDTTNNVETCKSCEGRVYPLEKVSCHNNIYHKNCFRCRECNTILRMDSYTYNQGLLYCLPHFKRLFISKGNYEAGFGLDQHKEKWNTLA